MGRPNPVSMLRSLFALILLGLTSCVQIQSNTRPGQLPSFRKMLVVLERPQDEVRESRQLLKECPEGYTLCTVSYHPTLSFEDLPEFVRKQNEACQAQATLIITRIPFAARDYAYTAGHGTGYTFQLELQSLPDALPIWKARIASQTEKIPARAIFRKLQQDGLLR